MMLGSVVYPPFFFSIIGNFDRNKNELVYDSAMVGVISLFELENTNLLTPPCVFPHIFIITN